MAVKIWDSGSVVRAIRKLHREGKDVSYSAMARKHQKLISAANYYHGTYREAVKLAGIDYASIRHKPYWNRPRIIKALTEAHSNGKELHWSSVSVRHDQLGRAAKAAIRNWKNWDSALKAAGLNPAAIGKYRHWDAKSVLRELKSRGRKKHPLNSKIIQEEVPGMYRAAVRHFGSFEAALKKSGFDPSNIAQRRVWSRKLVISELRDFRRSHRALSKPLLREHDSGLLRVVRIYFRDLPAAAKAAGIRL